MVSFLENLGIWKLRKTWIGRNQTVKRVSIGIVFIFEEPLDPDVNYNLFKNSFAVDDGEGYLFSENKND